jgi:hypothetical protein
MPTPTLTREQYREAVDAVERNGGNTSAAGRELGLDRRTVGDRLTRGKELGFHLSEGARASMHSAGMNGVEVQGGYKYVLDDEGRKLETVRWSAPKQAIAAEDMLERIRSAFEGITPAGPIKSPDHVKADSLAFLPHADIHIGMVATADQTGGRDYNRQIASDRFKYGVSSCLAFTPPSHTALILNAGDLLHANDDRDVTPRSGHKLKVEGSHHSNFDLSVQLTVYKIDLALQRHANVVYRAIPGNHDPNIPGPLSVALRAYYRNEPRVNVIVSEDEFWQFNWGNVFLSGSHGHNRKPKDACGVLPGKFSKAWGEATEWHYITAHLHNYETALYGSVRHHQLPSVCSIDTHSAWAPYPDTAGMMAMVFNKKGGRAQSIQISV